MNPFIIKGYGGKRFFCNREREAERILNAIKNKRDITLVSLRKMGKTGLIFHIFETLRKEKVIEPVYLDIYHTEDLNGIINKLATSLYRMKKSFGQQMKDFFLNFRFVRPVVSIDSLTGLPAVSFHISGEKEAIHTLEDLFAIIAERSRKIPIVVAIDEFQQIANYPEKNTEALIRGLTQSLTRVNFLYSGSNKTMLFRMFGEASRPFYQSTEMIYLEEIAEKEYTPFIIEHFKRNSRMIDEGLVEEILRLTRRHTWYSQYFCNKLFETGQNINKEIFLSIFRNILLENEPFYLEFRNLLTRYQWQLLKAFAHSGGSESVTSGDFIKKYNITNASTVKRGIDSLLEKEIIFKKDKQYFVYDVFFSRWLETQEILYFLIVFFRSLTTTTRQPAAIML